MLFCKLCLAHLNTENVSSADAHLCRNCYGDLVFARRYATSKRRGFEVATRMAGILEKIAESKARGGFVPKFYDEPIKDAACRSCGKVFKTVTESKTCKECELHAGLYLSLLRRGVDSPGLNKLRRYYANMQAGGYEVPKAFLEDNYDV